MREREREEQRECQFEGLQCAVTCGLRLFGFTTSPRNRHVPAARTLGGWKRSTRSDVVKRSAILPPSPLPTTFMFDAIFHLEIFSGSRVQVQRDVAESDMYSTMDLLLKTAR